MKRAGLITVLCWLLPSAAFAAPLCMAGSLASYVALGSGGCTVGSALFSNFADLGAQPGATPIPGVLVNPVTSGGPGFQFVVSTSAGVGDYFDRTIGYALSGPGFIGSQVALGGSSFTADGVNLALESMCLGAAFGPGQFCSAGTQTISGYDGSILGPPQLAQTLSFAPLLSLGVIVDISVDGSLGGTASLGSVTTQFTPQPQAAPVPEPGTLLLLGGGLAAVVGRQRFQRRNRQM